MGLHDRKKMIKINKKVTILIIKEKSDSYFFGIDPSDNYLLQLHHPQRNT